MPKRSSKKRPPTDVNQLAARIVAEATGDTPSTNGKPPTSEKNPAAVALGKLGGKKGGPARAKKLSAKRRADIARTAARKRWEKRQGS